MLDTAGENLKLAHYYIILINLSRHVFNVSVCSAQRRIFVIVSVFDIIQLRELSNLPPIGHLPAQSQQ